MNKIIQRVTAAVLSVAVTGGGYVLQQTAHADNGTGISVVYGA